MRLRSYYLAGICLVICSLVCTLLILWHQSVEANQIFGNMTYMTDSPNIAEKVTLLNGYCETRNFRLDHSMYYDGQYVYGDFNHDGVRDAAVVIGQGEGGSEDSRSLAFLIHDGTRFIHKKSAALGSSAIVNSLKERGGKVIVDMFVHQDGDCMAGPTGHVKSTFEYAGDRVRVKGEQKSAKSLFDPIILIFKAQSFTYVFERFQFLGSSTDLSSV